MTEQLRVLMVEDSEDDALLILRHIHNAGAEVSHVRVDTAESMIRELERESWDVVIADYIMPRFSGLEALRLTSLHDPDLPFILVSGAIGEETAVQAMKAGAHDYIMKSNLARLVPAIERELADADIRRSRRAAEDRLAFLALHDALTRLPNRVTLFDRLEQLILLAHRDSKSLSFLYIDLDGFKAVNDTLGHECGDLLLQELARRLEQRLRASDTVARLSGDEFAVLLPEEAEAGAVTVARKLLRAVRQPFTLQGQAVTAGASIGIAVFPLHGTDAHALVREADAAMYIAKCTGSGYRVSEPQQAMQPHSGGDPGDGMREVRRTAAVSRRER